jgi:hypothetical protein
MQSSTNREHAQRSEGRSLCSGRHQGKSQGLGEFIVQASVHADRDVAFRGDSEDDGDLAFVQDERVLAVGGMVRAAMAPASMTQL